MEQGCPDALLEIAVDGSAIGVEIALVVAIGLDAEVGVTKDGTESADWAVTANGDTTGCGEIVTGWQLAIRKSSTTTQTSKGRFILVHLQQRVAQRSGVSRPPLTRTPMVTTDAQLS